MFLLESYICSILNHYSLNHLLDLSLPLKQGLTQIKENKKYHKFLNSFSIENTKKLSLIKELFPIDQITYNHFWKLINFYLIKDTIPNPLKFLNLLNKQLQINLNKRTVFIYSPFELSPSQISKIKEYCFNKYDKEILFKFIINTELILGLKIIYNHSIIDYSLDKQFENFFQSHKFD